MWKSRAITFLAPEETDGAALPGDPIATGTVTAPDWCGLTWSPWVPLARGAIRATVPLESGVYRVRRAGEASRLVYLGQTGRDLRGRLQALARGANGAVCPFNDPHTAAPHLWLLRQQEGVALECSGAPVSDDEPVLRGTEDLLLWQHRLLAGCSTEANHGRFYPGYRRPTNRSVVRRDGTRVPGRRAEVLQVGEPSLDDQSHSVLVGTGGPLAAGWWQRAPLTRAQRWPAGPAVYAVHDRDAAEPVYFGETGNLPGRAAAHARACWPVGEPWLAWRSLPPSTPKPVLRELESDLLGWHFWHTGQAPRAQYRAEGTA
jgi:hypothetical protein